MSKTVVVLGAGVGGLTAAAELRTVLPNQDRIVLIDRCFTSSLGLSMLWVLRGWRTPDQITVRPTVATLPGVELVTGDIDRIDLQTQTVHYGPAGRISYDALIIALGASLDTSRLPGLPQTLDTAVAGQFYTVDGAATLHKRIKSLESGRIMVLVAAVPFKCPAAPFEAAFLIADQLGEKYTSGAVQVDTYTPDVLPMPVAGPTVGNALVDMMATQGIGFHGGKSATNINPQARTVEFADGTTESFDLLAVVPPHTPGAAVTSTGLGPNGWIPVDPATLATTTPGVFAIGDSTTLLLPNGKPLPKAAIFAETQGTVSAHQTARYLGYDAPNTRFTGQGTCYIELGGSLAAKGEGNFLTPPTPQITLRTPSAAYHKEKQQQEQHWLTRWNTRT